MSWIVRVCRLFLELVDIQDHLLVARIVSPPQAAANNIDSPTDDTVAQLAIQGSVWVMDYFVYHDCHSMIFYAQQTLVPFYGQSHLLRQSYSSLGYGPHISLRLSTQSTFLDSLRTSMRALVGRTTLCA